MQTGGMNVTEVKVLSYRLPLLRPLAVPGGEPLTEREGFLLVLRVAGQVSGWGDVAPLRGFSRESREACLAALLQLKEALPGLPWNAEWVLRGMYLDAFPGLPASVRFGLESAWLDGLSKLSGVALRHQLFDRAGDQVVWNGLVDPAGPDALERGRGLLASGYRTLKVKVGRRAWSEEVAFLEALLEGAPGNVQLRLDANRGWSGEEAGAAWERLQGFPVEYLEEPLQDPEHLADWMAATGAPVAADESAVTWGTELHDRLPGLTAVILKPTLIGGLVETRAQVMEALGHGVRPVISSAFESGVGIRALAQLAAGCGADPVPCGLDPYQWLAADVVEPDLELSGDTLDLLAVDRTVAVICTDQVKECRHG